MTKKKQDKNEVISKVNEGDVADNKDINYYYPTNILVTGHDIIFFWVARMIMSGYELRNNYSD